jgi:hypothetical protein
MMKSQFPDVRIDFVTLGSPAGLICSLSPWARLECLKMQTGPGHLPQNWKDYHIKGDWSGSLIANAGVLSPDVEIGGVQEEVGLEFLDKLMLKAHRRYWQSQSIVEQLLGGTRPS